MALAVALHCAPAMLVGIAQRESGLDPLTLRDDTTSQVLHGAGVVDAAKRLVSAGHSVDLGAWQINSRNLGLLGPGVTDAFEPCKAAPNVWRSPVLFWAAAVPIHLGLRGIVVGLTRIAVVCSELAF